jgi:hypothetical protein
MDEHQPTDQTVAPYLPRSDATVEQLRFEDPLGHYAVSVVPDSVGIFSGMGSQYFQIQLKVGIPPTGPAAGRLLFLETMLYAARDNGPRAPLASATIAIPFRPAGETRQPTLQYLLTNAQLLAIEQQRSGDLRLELQIRGILPQAASGFPGAAEITEYIGIAESRWRQQLAGLGRTVGVDMLVPFPVDEDPRRGAADFLREAQRLLGGNEIDSAMLQVRKSLETIRNLSTWNWPGSKKDKTHLTANERWALIRSAMEDQASGAMHVDAGTKDYKYARAEVETLIAMTAALLRIVA